MDIRKKLLAMDSDETVLHRAISVLRTLLN